LRDIALDRVRVVRHEDMHHRLKELMQSTVRFLDIDYHDCLLSSTFGGLLWWGDKAYNMQPMNKPNPRVISQGWQQTLPFLDWFVLEGLFYDYCIKYRYRLYKYKYDHLLNRLKVIFAILLPSYYEKRVFIDYMHLSNVWLHLTDAYNEAVGHVRLKDYSTNAYYRHKWSNSGLKLWKTRWYRRLIENLEGYSTSYPTFLLARIALVIARWCYILVNFFRYIYSIIIYPMIVLNRGILFLRAFFRMITKRSFLPEIL
jgi:hypothetical protein